ncbi:Peptidyl-tRNA hydrolase ICT1, mitochondrial [Zancudomyces culisetae]|uniref:Peptidyl-tRNA hydrolase ICT1, mitochondrial n=1 Tax=Zancudomyces culisetae TaxID=1213189 RepID=A0A1R1PXP4_ZANCU|nr:Peptidyl-tRNA hydrolase ICT1, mitochondrial [Zancudomyces culisetae]|eukprot:OMH85744.1 Peptidyl-tRNA hydrolase ICT1, mitochondrial [Zancudomyces culisetae]
MDSRLNKNGEVVLFSERTRSQRNNADDCFEKWLQALKEACYVPKDPSKEQVEKVEKLIDDTVQKYIDHATLIPNVYFWEGI